MVKKAPRQNAFFCYMLDFKRREEAKGVRFPNGLADVSKVAGEQWKLFSQEMKDVFKKKADEYNKSEERNQGLPSHYGNNKKKKKPQPAPPNRSLMLKEAKQRREKLFIQNLVEDMTINDLLNYHFYVAHVNVFCKTEDNEFVPAEIAISRFSLKNGVTDVFHRILNPGVTPLGYSYTIRKHSEKTHRIPLDFIKGTKGYLGMFKGIMDFLQPKGNSEQVPVLYTMFDEPFHNCSMMAVKYSLKRIWETCNGEDDDEEEDEVSEDEPYEKVFKVMSLPILFYHLKNKCTSLLDVDAVAFENTSEANIELLNDKYEFNENMACQFHIDIDNVRYCSQSYVVRWAQVIHEQCLRNLESDNEEEEVEEEQVAVTENLDELKLDYDLDLKNGKTEDSRPVKSEHEIKKEKYYGSSHRSEITNERHKKDIDDREIKTECDQYRRSYEDSRYKKERNRGYEERRIKKERDRGYDDVRSNRSSEPCSYSRIKTEKIDPDYDLILKSEHLDIPADVKIERSDVDDSYPRNSKKYPETSRDSSSSREVAHSGSNFQVKLERLNVEKEPSDIKITDLDCDSLLKTEHLDTSLDIKTERIDKRDSRIPDSNRSLGTMSAPASEPSLLIAESNPSNIQIKQERDLVERNPSTTQIKEKRHPDFPLPIPVKEEFHTRTEESLYNLPMTEIKNEPEFPHRTEAPRDDTITSTGEQEFPSRPEDGRTSAQIKELNSDFPLPIPVKEEFSPRTESTEPSRCDAATTSKASNIPTTTPIKKERDPEFPLPIPIKRELPTSSDPLRSDSRQNEKSNPPAQVEDHGDFPLPKKMKVELSESDFGSVRIKEEPQDQLDIKNEVFEIKDEDIVEPESPTPSMPEPMECTTSYTETVEVKKESVYESDREIKKEKSDD